MVTKEVTKKMKPRLKEFEAIESMSWLQDAPDVMRKEPVVKYKKLPSLSVQPNVAVAVKCTSEPRETTGTDNQLYAFMDVELIEPAVLYDKANQEEFKAPKGTKASINLKRHAALWRIVSKNFMPTTGKELVIANLGKRNFTTKDGKKASGYDYRVMTVEEIKAKMKKK